jgi:hypothetical protein
MLSVHIDVRHMEAPHARSTYPLSLLLHDGWGPALVVVVATIGRCWVMDERRAGWQGRKGRAPTWLAGDTKIGRREKWRRVERHGPIMWAPYDGSCQCMINMLHQRGSDKSGISWAMELNNTWSKVWWLKNSISWVRGPGGMTLSAKICSWIIPS